MTWVLCPECGRLLATVAMQTEDDRHYAVLVCRPCGRMYRMTLEKNDSTLNEKKEEEE